MKLPKANNYPKKIHINDEVYTVRVVKKIKHKDSGPGDHGICDFERKTIYVRSTQSARGVFRTFIHEVLHAIAYEHGFKLDHPTVYALEKSIDAFFADNFLQR